MDGNRDFDSIERRISVESRLVRLESETSAMRTDIIEGKELMSKIVQAIDKLTLEFSGAKSAVNTLVKTIGAIGTIVIMVISGTYYLTHMENQRTVSPVVMTQPH